MAEYKTIKGFKTQSYATDPVAATAAWSSGPSLNNGRQGNSGAGLQTAAITMGGVVPPGGAALAKTETYDGTSWTEVNNLTTARISNGSVGILTAAICFGGYIPPPNAATGKTETWDGTCWSERSDLGTARYSTGSGGTTTAAVCAGGNPGKVALSEEWDGTSWTAGNTLNNARAAMGWANQGTETAALVYGGGPGGDANNESYDGTCWAEEANLLAPTQTGAGSGISTLALYFGGANPGVGPTTKTESWDGTSWTEVSDMATGRGDFGGCGTAAAALAIGGPPGLTTTEIWNDYTSTNPAPSLTMRDEGQIWYNTTGNALKYTAIAAGTWASGGTMQRSNGSGNLRGTGTTTAALAVGGYYPSYYGYTEQYDGTSWTVKNPLNDPRYAVGCAGTTTAGLAIAGGIEGAPYMLPNTEEFDGTSWTEGEDLTDPRGTGVGCGTQTAALYSGGNYGTLISPAWQNSASNEEYNGTSWSEKNDLNTGRNYSCQFSAGSTTAALIAGGSPFATGAQKYTEQWNGTSWTVMSELNTGRNYGGGFGNSTSAVAFGGENPASSAVPETEQWDGTSWTEVANLTNPKQGVGGGGLTGTLGIAFGGGPPASTATEHWEAETLTVKTVTVS